MLRFELRLWFWVWWLGFASAAAPARADAGGCAEPFTPISAVQGTGEESALTGETTTVAGVVTGDFRGLAGSLGELGGVFIQDPNGDADPDSSDALFLYFGAVAEETDGAFASGTYLRAQGVVQEYEGETQLRVESVTACGDGAPVVPGELALPTASARPTARGWVAELEAQEGMLLTTEGSLTVADIGVYLRHGEVTLVRGALPWAFTQGNLPDVDAFGRHEQSIAQRTLVLDDGANALFPTPPASSSPRIGATWDASSAFVLRPPRLGAEGSQGAWRIVALAPPRWPQADEHVPAAATPAASVVRVVAINLHNLFKDGGDTGACYPSFVADDCRGQATAAGRAAQISDSAHHAAAWGADVIAASEVQNDFGGSATPTWTLWVEALNVAAKELGARCPRYTPIVPTDYHGGDAIAVALAYCAETLALHGHAAPSGDHVSGWGPGVFSGPNSSRLPLAGTWVRRDDGRDLTVVVNHFKSRSPGALPEQCPNPRLPDCDLGDGQGYFNGARTKAARAVAEWVSDEVAQGQPLLIVGDMNGYPREAPLAALEASDYWLLTAGDALKSPSYAYNGRLGVLDHLLISKAHLGSIAAIGVLSANVGRVPQSGVFSDHEAVFVDLRSDAATTCDCAQSTAIGGTPGDDVLWGTSGADVICGFGGDDVAFGLGGDDCISGGLGEDWVFTRGSTADPRRVEGEHVFDDSLAPPECDP